MQRNYLRFLQLFRWSLALYLFLGLLLGGCAARQRLSWQPAKGTDLESLAAVAIAQNTSLGSEAVSQALIAKLPAFGGGETHYLIDYNVQDVCGKLGCLYSIYARRSPHKFFQPVWSGYLSPYLPKNQPLFSPAASNDPCLVIRQVENQLIQNFTYCYNGQTYQIAENSLVEMKNRRQSP